MREINALFGTTVSKQTCYRARSEARMKLLGTLDDHYHMLPAYIAELKKVNRNGTFELVLNRATLDSLTELKGQLLSAVGKDGNNQMFPIAWAVVEGENQASWTWFIQLLMNDLGMVDGNGWTIISDQQKGLENAVSYLLPHAEHRNCARHIYANWKKKGHSIEILKNLFWKAVKCTTHEDFQQIMREMSTLNPKAAQDFQDIGIKKFCRAYISKDTKCEVIDNNICECFNNYIIQARSKPIIDMLEEIRGAVMQRIRGIPCPHAISCIHWIKEDPVIFVSEWLKKDVYQLAYSYGISGSYISANYQRPSPLKLQWSYETSTRSSLSFTCPLAVHGYEEIMIKCPQFPFMFPIFKDANTLGRRHFESPLINP
ncbi:uncharacterized protein LOC144712064 [Wolffia australiana]